MEEIINELIEKLDQKNIINTDKIWDGYHTFEELYYYRMLYNALLVNEYTKNAHFECYKSKKHNDGENCFNGNWFIVVIKLPTGIIDNHYEMKYWNLFNCPEVEKSPYKYDGHTPQDVANQMLEYLKGDIKN